MEREVKRRMQADDPKTLDNAMEGRKSNQKSRQTCVTMLNATGYIRRQSWKLGAHWC